MVSGYSAAELATTLEPITREAWPADEVMAWGGWVFRAHHGFTRRANSIWTAAPEPAGWQEVAAEFYGSRGLPVRLQLSDASPPGLEQRLAEAGYTAEAYTSVMTATASALAVAAAPASEGGGLGRIKVTLSSRPDSTWLDAYHRLEGFSDADRGAVSALVSRVAGSFAMATDAGVPVAAAMGAVRAGWVGVSGLVTAESHRGRGIARTLLGALVQRHAGSAAWLQVVDGNDGAARLYGRLGFVRAYGYHYRTRPIASDQSRPR